MPANLTDGEENRLLDLTLPVGANAITIKLRSTPPTDAAAGAAIAGNGYADQTFTVAAAAGGSKGPTADILFPEATADWPEIQGYDFEVAGERRWYHALAAGDRRTVQTGDQYRIKQADLSFSLS